MNQMPGRFLGTFLALKAQAFGTALLQRMRTRRPCLISPAAMALAEAGAGQHALAQAAGCSQVAVSRALSGERPIPPRLPVALVDLVGEDAALAILDAIPRHAPATEAAATGGVLRAEHEPHNQERFGNGNLTSEEE